MLISHVLLFSKLPVPSLPTLSSLFFCWYKECNVCVCGRSVCFVHLYFFVLRQVSESRYSKKITHEGQSLKSSTKIMNQTKSKLCSALIFFFKGNDRMSFLFMVNAIGRVCYENESLFSSWEIYSKYIIVWNWYFRLLCDTLTYEWCLPFIPNSDQTLWNMNMIILKPTR